MLSAAYPDIACLPQREREICQVVDVMVCSGNGTGRDKAGRIVVVDVSQGLSRGLELRQFVNDIARVEVRAHG